MKEGAALGSISQIGCSIRPSQTFKLWERTEGLGKAEDSL